MGIADNLREFMDPEYEYYDESLTPKTTADAASRWTGAIKEELLPLLLPMSAAQLIGAGIGSFNITEADITLPNFFYDALDAAISDAASNVADVSGACMAPPAPLDSKNMIFDTNPGEGKPPQYTVSEICQRAEDRIIAWLMTGTFTAFFYPPAVGLPLTPWILPPGSSREAPDTDGDGYDDAEEDEAGTDPADKSDYPDD